MIYKKFKLNEYFPSLTDYPTVRAYLHESVPEFGAREYPSMIVLPGGGYCSTSEREAEPVAVRYFAEGFNAFVLDYTVAGCGIPYPNALIETACLIDLIRGGEFGERSDTSKICVVGFSAGGHLAGNIATDYDNPKIIEVLGRPARPDCAILGYPVLSPGVYRHGGSFQNLTGSENEKDYEIHDNTKRVRPDMPPVFLFHTANDETVPVQNTLIFAKELADKGVAFECHVYPDGRHGLSLANSVTNTLADCYDLEKQDVARWIDDSVRFMELHGIKIIQK